VRKGSGAGLESAKRSSGHAGLGQQPVERLARRRPSEQEALHLLAAGEPEQYALLLSLDTLGEQRQPERPAESDNGLHYRLGIGAAAERLDEALVDLELVELEALQIGQAGIAGAEIDDREPHAEGLERIEAELDLVGIVDQHAFGDL